jgi:hypothetical protein
MREKCQNKFERTPVMRSQRVAIVLLGPVLALLAACGTSSKGQASGATMGQASTGNTGASGASAAAGTSVSGGAGSGSGSEGSSNSGTSTSGSPAGASTASSDAGPDGTSVSGGGSGTTGAASGVGASGAGTGAGTGGAAALYTRQNDLARTGLNPNETTLTPSNVNMAQFGKKFAQPVDGQIYAQPLYMPGLAIPNKGTHNVVYVATENDSVYAFDADSKQAPLWQVSFLSAGVTPVPAMPDADSPTIQPQIGITGTPVIDPATSTLYVVAETKVAAGPAYFYHLHALDLATGAEKLGGPVAIDASVTGTGADAVNGVVTLSAQHELQRAGLAFNGGVVYIAFGAHGDRYQFWHGWVLGYDATTLTQKFIYCTTPDADEGSIWMSGSGIAIDPQGNLYVESGNGTIDAMGGGRDLAMSVIKLSAQGAMLDWFAPHDAVALSNLDVDLGSAGPMILPEQTGAQPHIMIGAGKPGYMYLLDRDQMGHIGATDDSQVLEKVTVAPNTNGNGSGIFATPVYWNGVVFESAVADKISAFAFNGGMISAMPTSQTTQTFAFPGALITASSNGSTGAILWAVQGDGYQPTHSAVLYAFDATNLGKMLWNSGEAPTMRDQAGPVAKYCLPAVVNGHVYLGTQTELDVYGEL